MLRATGRKPLGKYGDTAGPGHRRSRAEPLALFTVTDRSILAVRTEAWWTGRDSRLRGPLWGTGTVLSFPYTWMCLERAL